MTVRRDKGIPQLTPRDRHLLTWIGEQYAVRFDTLEKLLGGMPGKSYHQPKEPGKLNRKTVYHAITRWEKAGMAEYQTFWKDTPGWVWLTSTGMRARSLLYAPWSPRQGTDFEHLHMLNELRLRMENRYGDQPTWQWVCERTLRKDAGDSKQDPPDAVATVDGSTIAIQLELTPKTLKRTQAIITNLLSQYEGIWYFVTKATEPVVRKSIASSQAKKVNLYPVEEVIK